MKIDKIPYIRLFPKLFDYRSRLNRKDFIIDYSIFMFTSLIIIFFSFLLTREEYPSIGLVILMVGLLLYNISFALPIFARRLRDTSNPWWLTFFSMLFYTRCVVMVYSLGKTKEKKDKKKTKELENNNDIETATVEVKQKEKTSIKVLRIIGIILYTILDTFIFCLSICFIIAMLLVPTVTKVIDINKYQEKVNDVEYAKDFMPNLDSINSNDIRFGYRDEVGFFESEGISLFITYDDNYEEEKKKIDDFDYLTEPVMDNNRYLFPLAEFEYKGYVFRIVPNRKNYSGYITVKSFMIVGYNDSKKTICYLYFYDLDLDYMCEGIATDDMKYKEMTDFIDRYFIWYD